MRGIVVLPLLVLLLVGCGVTPETGKGHAVAPERVPTWVDEIGAECGVLLADGTPDLEARCGIGDALYVGP